MLFCKILHKSNFVKEIFKCNFTNANTLQDQLLIVTEKSIELYDYIYDSNLRIPFLEPKFNQELFVHILDCKVMTIENIKVLILLCTCGLLILKYIDDKFKVICSEVLNINCEERDRLMYLACNDELGLIAAYSNTNDIFIFKWHSYI